MKLKELGWANVTPIWAVDDLSQAEMVEELPDEANFTLINSEESSAQLSELVNGYGSNCLPSCKKTNIQILRRTSTESTFYGASTLKMRFPQEIQANIPRRIALSTDVLIAVIGGNIGFWLGISIVQVLASSVSRIKEHFIQ